MSNLRRRLEGLERLPPRTHGGPSEARRRMGRLLSRYAAARRSGTVTEELRAEMESVRQAIRERLDRGEGRR